VHTALIRGPHTFAGRRETRRDRASIAKARAVDLAERRCGEGLTVELGEGLTPNSVTMTRSTSSKGTGATWS